MQRLIFHVDVNSAFLSWEAARRAAAGEADLRLIPSAIGVDRDKRTGIILAKSIPAKAFGVTTGEPVGMALRKCPQLVLAPPDFRLYSKNSKAFIAVCRRYAPVVEQAFHRRMLPRHDRHGAALSGPGRHRAHHQRYDLLRAGLHGQRRHRAQ